MKNGNHAPGARAFVGALVFALLAVIPASGRTAFTGIVAFGDSLSDPGNAALATGGLFPPQDLYPAGTFSNGPVWVDYLATRLGLEDRVTNLAFGGAFTGSGNLRVAGLPGISEELGMYDQMTGGAGDPDALYLIQGGANELFLWLESGTPTPPEVPIATSVTNLVAAVNHLADIGAKHFIVWNLPDVGSTPFGTGSGAGPLLTGYCSAFNTALEDALHTLAVIRGLKITILDEFGFLNRVIASPGDYGLTNVTVPYLYVLSGDPGGFLFWDGVHPTTAGHRLTARFAFDELAATYLPAGSHASVTGRLHSLNGLVKAP